MKKSVLVAAVIASLFTARINAIEIKVLDKTLHPASNFLAYTEFELSGEPLAQALGLDLDMLDPHLAASPTAFDFAAGIESYEYSEEAMYALNYQSTMGVHLVNGPLNQKRGGTHQQLKDRFKTLALAVGFNSKNIAKNMYPLSIPYASGDPEFAQKVDTRSIKGETFDIITAKGNTKTLNTVTPAYLNDYKSLAWDPTSFNKSFNPAAIGGILLKEVMWSQDFLGGMHIRATDEEISAESKHMDQNDKYALGVSAADGFNGVVLTELSIDKLLTMQQQLGFDGKNLGVKFAPDYNPINGAIWFPHQIAVEEGNNNSVNSIKSLKITDPTSQLRDTWQLLWPLAEFFAFSDQRIANKDQNPAMLATFDGAPFASAPKVNIDENANNDILADDAFSLANNISGLVFKNISALHFNQKHGTFITEYKNGLQGTQVNTYDAAYSIVALSIFQRAKDALPVGYASAESTSVDLNTQEGQQALAMIKAQADFILAHLITDTGLVADGIDINTQALSQTLSIDAQFSTIRGLVAAFISTKNIKYKTTARNIYLAVEKHMFDKNINTWATIPGKPTMHTPYTQAAISGGLRETILHLKNEEGENNPALELQNLTQRYVSWFNTVINGAMQLAEPLGDTGELAVKDTQSTDTDEDGVKQIIAAGGQFGTATTMANKVSIK